jgi:tRNA threonylcarbamoyladenosine biosynthesis protein TsaB
MLLALDTSTALAGVALYDGAVRAELTWHAGRGHTTQVLPEAVRLLEAQGLGPRDLRAVAVATGPGSYTGLRVGLGVAKGLAVALRLPLVGVCTLDAMVAPFLAAGRPVRAALDAGRGRYATALYEREADALVRREAITTVDLAGLAALLRPPLVLAAELNAAARESLLAAPPAPARDDTPGVEIATPAAATRRAGFLAELAWDRLASEGGADPAAVEPIYLG